MNKHFEIFQPWLKGWPKKFKWEWRLEWEENDKGNLKGPDHWTHKNMVFKNRRQVREWKSYVLNADWCRNICVKRRLVQVNWEPYNDSFTWNNGCGKR